MQTSRPADCVRRMNLPIFFWFLLFSDIPFYSSWSAGLSFHSIDDISHISMRSPIHQIVAGSIQVPWQRLDSLNCNIHLFYSTRAAYIPFTNMKRIDIDFLHMGPGIRYIHLNDSDRKDSRRCLTVTFSEPPTELKLLACSEGVFPFIQVSLT